MMTSTTDSPLVWHDVAEVLGVGVQVHFFDPEQVGTRPGFAERCLPIFPGDALPQPIGGEDLRPIYTAGDVWAQPDAVFEHGNGLLCLTHRSTAKLSLDHSRWKGELRADAVLLAVVVAMVVAGSRQRPTAALLRAHDALLLLSPGPPVLECIATSVEAARRYWATPRAVSAVQLARYVEPVLRALPGVRTPTRPMAPEVPVD